MSKATKSFDAAATFLDQPAAQPSDPAPVLSRQEIYSLVKIIIEEGAKRTSQTTNSLEGWTKGQFRTFTKRIAEAIPGLSLPLGEIKAAKSVKDVVKIVTANLE